MKTEELLERMEYDREYKFYCTVCGEHLRESDVLRGPYWTEFKSKIKVNISRCCGDEIRPR